jgi:branched-chain amino acid transport system substrate-binding protein
MSSALRSLRRRTALGLAAAFTASAVARPGRAGDKVLRIPINMPFTGQEAEGTVLVKNGAVLAMEDINAKGGAAGIRLEPMLMDDGTSTAGGYDPAQAAINARRMVADPTILVAIGPYNSGSGKAMSPILSEASLAIITPTSTTPDITDPKFAQIYRPAGPAIYFRTVSNDAYQGPNMMFIAIPRPKPFQTRDLSL